MTRLERRVVVSPGILGSLVMDVAGRFAGFQWTVYAVAVPIQLACLWGSWRLA